MEVEMKMVKSLLLGTAAGFVAVAGAQAADMPVKAKPVQYVKICSLYGDAFYYIPGTDTCIKFGGYVRVQAEYNAGRGGIPDGSGPQAGEGRVNRWDDNKVNYRSRGALSVDVRQQTEYGTLRTYFRTGIQVTTPVDSEGGAVFIDRAFIQFAGFTVGKTQSFFDLFTYGGGMSYHNVRTAGDTGAIGLTLWAYTAQFGNGFSGTLSLESPNRNRALNNLHPVVDVTNAGFFGYASVLGDTAFEHNAAGNGFRVPDIVANLRVDQAWGFWGLSGALHDSSGAYYLTPDGVNNGHPADRLGWAVATGGQFNLQGGDQIGANFCYSEGAAGHCTNAGLFGMYNSSTSVGVGWIADGIFDTGTAVELTKVWSINAGYQHIWNPKWRTSLYGGYVNIEYGGAATNIINSHFAPAGKAACGVAGLAGAATFTYLTPAAGNGCSPDWSFWSVGTRTQWNPVAQLDIGLDLLYTHLNTAYKGAAVVAATGARPAIAGLNVVDDQDVWSAFFRWQRNFYP
jgi:hypothetical protein